MHAGGACGRSAGAGGQQLRVGSRVPAVGDSGVSTSGLPGEPQYRGAIEDGHGVYRGERWQCQANRRMATVTIVAGKAADIRIGQR